MRKKNDGGHGRGTKVRFIMLEVDSADGNLTELTRAITSAVRPSGAPIRVLTPAMGSAGTVQDESTEEEIEVEDASESEAGAEGDGDGSDGETTRARRPRKYPLPSYLHDLDVKSPEPSLEKFASARSPKKHLPRYLVASMWLSEHAGVGAITTDHVYTCYKTLKWPTNINDWDAAFRQLVKQDRMRRVEGGYAMTPLGEDAVNKMGAPTANGAA